MVKAELPKVDFVALLDEGQVIILKNDWPFATMAKEMTITVTLLDSLLKSVGCKVDSSMDVNDKLTEYLQTIDTQYNNKTLPLPEYFPEKPYIVSKTGMRKAYKILPELSRPEIPDEEKVKEAILHLACEHDDPVQKQTLFDRRFVSVYNGESLFVDKATRSATSSLFRVKNVFIPEGALQTREEILEEDYTMGEISEEELGELVDEARTPPNP